MAQNSTSVKETIKQSQVCNALHRPSEKTLNFIRSFARNYTVCSVGAAGGCVGIMWN